MLFGLETYNGGTEPFRNHMARIYAEHYRKRMTSGSDFHNLDSLGRGGIITDREIHTPQDLVNVLKSGNYSNIEDGKES